MGIMADTSLPDEARRTPPVPVPMTELRARLAEMAGRAGQGEAVRSSGFEGR